MFGILWDSVSFQFFKFDGSTVPFTFHRGALSNDSMKFRKGFNLPTLTSEESTLPFIRSVRQISEITFDLLLCAYISSMQSFCDRSDARGLEAKIKKDSLKNWENALKYAWQALTFFREGETKRLDKDQDRANQAVAQARTALAIRSDFIASNNALSHKLPA